MNILILAVCAIVLMIIFYFLKNPNQKISNEYNDKPELIMVLNANCSLDDDIFVTNKANSMFVSQFEAKELQQVTKMEAAEYFIENFGLANNYVKVNMHEHHSNPKLNYEVTVNGNKYKVQDIGYTINMKDDGFATFGLYLFGPYAIKYTADTVQYINKPYTCSLKMMRGPKQDSFGNKGKGQGMITRDGDKVTIKNILTL